MADKSETFVPLFLLGYQLARFTVVSPPNRSLLLASLPVCPDLCSRLIVLAQFPTHDLSLPAHRKDYHTRNTRLRTVVPPTIIVFVSSLLSLSPFPPLLSFFETRFLAPSHDSDRSPENHPRSNEEFYFEQSSLEGIDDRDRLDRHRSSLSPFSNEKKSKKESVRHLGLRNDSIGGGEFSSNRFVARKNGWTR